MRSDFWEYRSTVFTNFTFKRVDKYRMELKNLVQSVGDYRHIEVLDAELLEEYF